MRLVAGLLVALIALGATTEVSARSNGPSRMIAARAAASKVTCAITGVTQRGARITATGKCVDQGRTVPGTFSHAYTLYDDSGCGSSTPIRKSDTGSSFVVASKFPATVDARFTLKPASEAPWVS